MNLKVFVDPQRVILDLTAVGQLDAMTQLAQSFAATGIVDDVDVFLADLQRREAEVTTVMDNGVAIPHARSGVVRRLGLTVGMTGPQGVLFNPEDNGVTRLFFCLAIPAFAPTCHIPLLQALAKFSREPNRVERLLSSKSERVAARYLGAFKG